MQKRLETMYEPVSKMKRGRKPTGVRPHKVISVSLYDEDLADLDRKVEALKSHLQSKAIHRSKVIRLALDLLSDDVAAAHLGTPEHLPDPGQVWLHRATHRMATVLERSVRIFHTFQDGPERTELVTYRFKSPDGFSMGRTQTVPVEKFMKSFKP